MNSHPIPPFSNFIKKKGGNYKRGDQAKTLRRKKKEKKTNKKQTKKKKAKITTSYENLNRGKPH